MALNMKKVCLKNFWIYLFLPILLVAFGMSFLCMQTSTAHAELTSNLPAMTNGKFTITPNVYDRKGTSLAFTTQTVTTSVGDEITYYIFKWRDISHLSFNFTSNIQDSTEQYVGYELTAGNIQTENLETDVGQMTFSSLTSGVISNNTVNIPVLYYYFDKDLASETSINKKYGNDFGLYKFDFRYTVVEDDISHTIALPNALYIAILPDNIDTISTNGLSVSYTVSSSSKLMSIYNLSLSDPDAFKYINPNYIEWSVVGKDKNNVNYVLSEKVKNSKIEYANYHIIWTSQLPSEPIGPTFRFDSNNIEGTWIVYCTIFNSSKEERVTISSNELSTIKIPAPSYLWVVFLIAGVAIAGGVVALIIYKNKNKNKA